MLSGDDERGSYASDVDHVDSNRRHAEREHNNAVGERGRGVDANMGGQEMLGGGGVSTSSSTSTLGKPSNKAVALVEPAGKVLVGELDRLAGGVLFVPVPRAGEVLLVELIRRVEPVVHGVLCQG